MTTNGMCVSGEQANERTIGDGFGWWFAPLAGSMVLGFEKLNGDSEWATLSPVFNIGISAQLVAGRRMAIIHELQPICMTSSFDKIRIRRDTLLKQGSTLSSVERDIYQDALDKGWKFVQALRDAEKLGAAPRIHGV